MIKENLFEGIAGYKLVKEEMKSVVSLMNDKEKFVSKGARFPRGILLYGEPGMGKTKFVDAVVDNINAKAVRISESEAIDQNISIEELVIKAFSEARSYDSCVVVVDELDKLVGYHYYSYNRPENLKLQKIFLHELDKISKTGNCIVIATANKLEILSSSILRTGRFEKKIRIDMPNSQDRTAITNLYLNDISIEEGVSVKELAHITKGCSCSDIQCIVNEAIILSVKDESSSVKMSHFTSAFEKIVFADIVKEKEDNQVKLATTAYHEAGHAIVAYLCDKDCFLSASILPQGESAGSVLIAENPDSDSHDVKRYINSVKVSLAGKLSAEIMTGSQKTGNRSDLGKACSLIEKLMNEGVFGYEYITPRPEGDRILGMPKNEDMRLVTKRTELLYSYDAQVREMLEQNKSAIQEIADELLKKSRLESNEIRTIISKHNCK